MFVHNDADFPFNPAGEGVKRKVLGYNEEAMLCELTFETGAVGAMHTHPHTQVSYVVSGAFDFTVDGKTERVKAGDSVLMPADVPHGVVCAEGGILVDVFTPMRKDFL